MDALTPAERRGALLVVLLLALGAGHDLLQVSRPGPDPSRPGESVMGAEHVPAPAAPGPGGTADGADDRGRGMQPPAVATLDLNRASAHELESLPGVGPVLAGRIVDHRDRHGPFRDAEELLAVRGIGRRLLARLRPLITVGPGASPPASTGQGPGAEGG